jgi:hypothetical protein
VELRKLARQLRRKQAEQGSPPEFPDFEFHKPEHNREVTGLEQASAAQFIEDSRPGD